MAFNLIRDAWIPLIGEGGAAQRVRPAEVVACTLSGARVSWPRADFAGACWEFLVGLVQVSDLLPADDTVWEALWEAPPDLAVVDAALAPLAKVFDLDGPGPRFLQDASIAGEKPSGIATLLIDNPGDNTLSRNMDIFVKRGAGGCACPACAAMALYTMQTYAPSGGAGVRTSLRGGGPLTTLVLAKTPWHTIWANVLPRDRLTTLAHGHDPFSPGPVFPWTEPLRTSEAKGAKVEPGQAPFLQTFWGQPRRYWLDFDAVSSGRCALCGDESDDLLTQVRARPRGVNYEGGWRHPLSPYSLEPGKPETLSARKGSPQGLDYRDWLGLVTAREATGKSANARARQPAAPVARWGEARPREALHLWTFGYDTDNMKARGWIDSRMPLYPGVQADHWFIVAVGRALGGTEQALWALTRSLRSALAGDSKDAAKAEFPAQRLMLMDRTRAPFFALLEDLRARDGSGDGMTPSAVTPLIQDWHRILAAATLAVFDEAAEVMPPAVKAKQLAEARRWLIGRLWGKDMAEATRLMFSRKTAKPKEAA
jgi:CRISPR system Cascade subunit CasA